MKTLAINNRKSISRGLLFILFALLSYNVSSQVVVHVGFNYNRGSARSTINKTSYVINEAYDIVRYYDYWSSSYLSRAVYYNNYAEKLYKRRQFTSAINYSLRAREYALLAIDNCSGYWEYYYYSYYGWSHTHGRNPHLNSNHNNGRYDGRYDSYYDRYNGGRKSDFGATKPGGNFNNVQRERYFDEGELKALGSAPTYDRIESDFKRDNPRATFDDSRLRNDKSLMKNTRNRASEFSRENKSTRDNIRLERPQSVTRETKPSTQDRGESTRPSESSRPNRETRPASNNNSRETAKPTERPSREARPSTNNSNSREVKTSNERPSREAGSSRGNSSSRETKSSSSSRESSYERPSRSTGSSSSSRESSSSRSTNSSGRSSRR